MKKLLKLSKLINGHNPHQDLENNISEKQDISLVQGNYTDEDINELLKDFIKVDNTDDLKLGDEIRYYTFVKQNEIEYKVFKLGGTIYEINFDEKFLIIGNGKFSWKLKFNRNIFYKKIDILKIKKYYESEINNIESEKQEIQTEYTQIKNNYGKLKNNQKLLMNKAQELIENVKELQTNNEQLLIENKYFKKIIRKKLNNNIN